MGTKSLNALLITIILWGVAALLFAMARPTRADEKPAAAGEFLVTLEGHYLSNLGEKTRWGVLTTLVPGLPVTGNFNILPKWGGGGRVGLGYRAAAGWDVVALGDADWLYSGHQQTLLTNSQFLLGSQLFLDRLALNPFFGSFANGQVSADAQTAYNYVDLESGYNLKFGTSFDARLFLGARYANFDQNIQTTGPSLSLGFVQFDTRREITYWGVGPRLGGAAVCGSASLRFTS